MRNRLFLIFPAALLLGGLAVGAENGTEESEQPEIDYSRLIFEAEILAVPGEAPAAVTQADGVTGGAAAAPAGSRGANPAVMGAAVVATPDADRAAISRYENDIGSTLEDTGPYSDPLREQYESLGELYQRTGDHEKAIANFENAMHIDRVNDGLFTLRQIPLVENIIESYTAMNNVDEVDDHHEYLFYIQQKSYADDDPRFLAAKEQWADWNVESFLKTGARVPGYPNGLMLSNSTALRQEYVAVQNPRNGQIIFVPRQQMSNVLNPQGAMTSAAITDYYMRSSAYAVSAEQIVDERLRRARELYEELVESPNEQYHQERGVDLEHKLANIAYAVKQQIEDLEGSVEEGSLAFNRMSAPRATNPMVNDGYIDSRESLEAIATKLAEDPASDPVQTARAYINLGDLHLGFDRVSRSDDAYIKALEVLSGAGKTSEEISAVFNPKPLIPVPGFALHAYTREMFGLAPEVQLPYKGFIDVTLVVKQSGDVNNIRIVATTENTTSRLRGVLLDYLREHRMRPIVQNGTLVKESPMSLRIHFTY